MKLIWFAKIFYILFFLIIELGLIRGFSNPWHTISPSLLVLIAWAIDDKSKFVWVAAVFSGIIFDSTSVFPVGTFIILNTTLVLLVKMMFYRFFSNSSILIYPIISFVGLLFYFSSQALIQESIFLISKLDYLKIDFFFAIKIITIGALGNAVLAGFAVYVFNAMRNRLTKHFYPASYAKRKI